MREIKFRAWLKRSEEMYQVENIDFEKQEAFHKLLQECSKNIEKLKEQIDYLEKKQYNIFI